jgi:MFS family permease
VLIRDFRLLWVASVLTSLAIQIRNVSNLYQVYQISGSAFKLGLTGFLEALPFIFFGLFAGAVADAFDRKKVLVATMVVQLVPSVAMALLTYTDTVQVWHIYGLGFLGSFVDVFNWPARSALVPRLVPPGLLMNAVTINAMIIQLSFLIGPALGGVLIDHTGLAVTYLISTMTLLPAIIAIISIRSSGKPEGAKRRVSLRSMVEGVEFIWIQRIILSLFLLDFGVTLVGFYRPILPIFAADVFKMGASGLGLLYAAPSAGSLIGSATLLMAGDIKRKGIAVVMAAVGFAASLALLGVSQWFSMAVAAVIVLGVTDSVSVAIRRTVVQLLSPDDMLGRASSLIVVFAQTTNGLGALLAGSAAQFIGAPNSLLVGSGVCFLMILAICIAIPQLWRYRSD